MKDHRITVRLSPEIHSRLRTAARRSGSRESEFVRSALEMKLSADDAPLTAYDCARKAKLIGAVKAEVHDLSTSRKHFEGFGKP